VTERLREKVAYEMSTHNAECPQGLYIDNGASRTSGPECLIQVHTLDDVPKHANRGFTGSTGRCLGTGSYVDPHIERHPLLRCSLK
jgi:hypothetical protein